MSNHAESDLGQQAGGGLCEPCWAGEAQTGKASWRYEDLDLESFVSGHAPYEDTKKVPGTPMAEEITVSSRYHPPLATSGQSVDATTTTRRRDNEAHTAKNVPMQLPPQRLPTKAPVEISPSEGANDSRLSQEYFPISTPKLRSINHLSMEPPTRSPKYKEAGMPSNSSGRMFNSSTIQVDEREVQSAAWTEVRNLREEILGLRSRVHQKRDELKDIERIKAEADNQLFKRMLLEAKGHHLEDRTLSKSQKTLQQLMDDCQKARDDYGPKEAECTSLEDQMSILEFRLNRLEQPFFLQIEEPRHPLGTVSHHPIPDAQASAPESVVSTDDEFDEPEYHPLVLRYLSKLGDLDLLHERRDNLVEEKLSLEEEKEKRGSLGMTLCPDDQAWLEGSQAEYESLARDVLFLERDLVDLRKDCFAQGLIDEHGEPTDFANLEAASFHNEEDLNPHDQTSEYVKHPILLPLHPGRKKKAHVETYRPEFESDEASENPTTRINSWMLKSLRMSPLDVNFLARIFEDGGGQPSAQWEHAVLQFWFRDVSMLPRTKGERAYASSLVTETDIVTSSTPKHQDESPYSLYFNSTQMSHSFPVMNTELVFIAGNPSPGPQKHIFRNIK